LLMLAWSFAVSAHCVLRAWATSLAFLHAAHG